MPSPRTTRLAARPVAAIAIVAGLVVPSTAPAEGLWNDVARAPSEEAARERRQAMQPAMQPAAGAGRGLAEVAARAEAPLRRAVRAAPGDFEARRQLAELLSATGRPREAAREFAAARWLAPSRSDEARIWFRLANERSRLGAYAQALDAYARQLALGEVDTAALGNSAELAMALGRLDEAIDRYREAVAVDERDRDRRDRLQPLALGYFGLAVALDRAERPVAAREALGRAIAFDPGLAVLRLAEQGEGDLFFVPPGDVFYYLGLARELQGRVDDAAAAFQNYLRVASGPYTARARAHLAQLVRGPPAGVRPSGRPSTAAPAAPTRRSSGDGYRLRLRVVHEATLASNGPIVAPLIDAAWRLDRRLLDDCLASVDVAAVGPGGETPWPPNEYRISLELHLDETGKPTTVVVEPPPGIGGEFAGCLQAAIKDRLRVSRPARRKPTRARIELVLAPAEPSGL